MRILRPVVVSMVCALAVLTGGCAGTPVELGNRAGQAVPTGPSRDIEGSGCGFQLLLFIPISVNGRLQRAYAELQEQAHGDYITDVQVQERWTYGFVGTGYCTELKARAIAAHG